MGKYYEKWSLNGNPDKTQVSSFHLNNHMARHKLNITWYDKLLDNHPNPVYLGVTLDRTLSFSKHIEKLKGKTSPRNCILKKISK